jgi:hypothetical protein
MLLEPAVLHEHSPLQPLSSKAPTAEPTFAGGALRTPLAAIFRLAGIGASHGSPPGPFGRHITQAKPALNPFRRRHDAAKAHDQSPDVPVA